MASDNHPPRAYHTALVMCASLSSLMLLVEGGVGLWIGSGALLGDAMKFIESTSAYSLMIVAANWSARRRAIAGLVTAIAMWGVGFAGVVQIASHSYFGDSPAPIPMAVTAAAALVVILFSKFLMAPFAHRNERARVFWFSPRTDVSPSILTIAGAAGIALTGLGWPDILVGGFIVAINTWSALDIIVRVEGKARSRS